MAYNLSFVDSGNSVDNYQGLSDTQLINLTCLGNPGAFEMLVQRYSQSIFNYLYRLSRDPHLAEDLSQDVFLRAYVALPKINSERPFRPWLFQVAHNCCIDELRRRRRQAVSFSFLTSEGDNEEEEMIDTIADVSPLPDEQAEYHEAQDILSSAIASLPFKYRAVTTLRYVSQLTFAEIGTVLEMPEATAKTYFARAKALLRTVLSEKYHYSFL